MGVEAGRPTRLQEISRGGQAIVESVSWELAADEVDGFVQQNWPMTWENGVGRLLLVSKRIKAKPSSDGLASEQDEDLAEARAAWMWLAREHRLLAALEGVGVPRVPWPQPYEPDDDPWQSRVLMAYVAGASLNVLAPNGVRPDVDQHLRMSRGLAATLQHAAEVGVAHRDISPGQVIIPVLASGGLDWANPVLVDFAYGYHPEIALINLDGVVRTQSTAGGRTGHTPGFEAPDRTPHHDNPATDQQFAAMVSWDVFGWAQVCAYAAAGEWVFGYRGPVYADDGREIWLGDPPYADLMAGQEVDYAKTPPTHIDKVPEAMRPAILAGLSSDPRQRTWDHIAPLLPPDPDQARHDAAIDAAVAKVNASLARVRKDRDRHKTDLTHLRTELAATQTTLQTTQTNLREAREERDRQTTDDLARLTAERDGATQALERVANDFARVSADLERIKRASRAAKPSSASASSSPSRSATSGLWLPPEPRASGLSSEREDIAGDEAFEFLTTEWMRHYVELRNDHPVSRTSGSWVISVERGTEHQVTLRFVTKRGHITDWAINAMIRPPALANNHAMVAKNELKDAILNPKPSLHPALGAFIDSSTDSDRVNAFTRGWSYWTDIEPLLPPDPDDARLAAKEDTNDVVRVREARDGRSGIRVIGEAMELESSSGSSKALVVAIVKKNWGAGHDIFGNLLVGLARSFESDDFSRVDVQNFASSTVCNFPLLFVALKNSKMVRDFYRNALDSGLAVNAIVKSEKDGRVIASRTIDSLEYPIVCVDDLEFIGAGIFGSTDVVRRVLRGFQFWY